MDVQNVTVALPKHLLTEAKHLAVDEGVSLSRFVSAALEQRVYATRAFHSARERQLEALAKGVNLGTDGRSSGSRDSLHER